MIDVKVEMMTDLTVVGITVAEEIMIATIDVIVTETAMAEEIGTEIAIIIDLVVMILIPILAHRVGVSKKDIMIEGIEMTTGVGTEIIADKLIKRETILQEEIDPHIIQMMLLTGLSNSRSTLNYCLTSLD